MSVSLSPVDLQCLQQWLDFCVAHPGALPADVEPVQARLVRAVGRGRLPDGGGVYLKTMGFPRRRDRWRYWLRPLPAAHEAAVLRAAAAAGVACPRVLGVCARRRFWRRPIASVLATAALAVDGHSPPRLREGAELACRLAEAGIAHRDLHQGNFVRTADGTCAVLDLQSARRRRRGVPRLPLAARLLSADWAEPELPCAVVDAGLLRPADLATAVASAQILRRDAVRRRVERCWVDSTEFCLCRRRWGTLVQRRHLPAAGVWHRGGREVTPIWFGARFLEVVAAEPSPLLAITRAGWPRRHGAIYTDARVDPAAFDVQRPRWLRAHADFVRLCRARTAPAVDLDAPLPWTGSHPDAAEWSGWLAANTA